MSNMYMVVCAQCTQGFDALKTSWCDCLGKEQTLVCPHCFSCFCGASDGYKKDLWTRAPNELTQRRLAHSKQLTTSPSEGFADPGELTRPLILVVDDDEAILRLASRFLRRMEWGVMTATDGLEGLASAKEFHPELVLADALMPRLDGREMCLRLKKEMGAQAPRVVIMTGIYKGRKYEKEAEDRFAADGYLSKPINLEELAKLVRRILLE